MISADRADRIGAGIMAIGFASDLASLVVVGCQSLFWLRKGYWPRLSVLDTWVWAGFDYPQSTGWFGMDKLVGWTLDSPLSACLFWGGLAIVGAGVVFAVGLRER